VSASRRPAFADDRWYPSSSEALKSTIDGLLTDGPALAAIAIVAPHAGLFYSGRVAGAVYGSVVVPNRVILLGPNHRGVGARAAIMREGTWLIPGAEIPIDSFGAAQLMRHEPSLVHDPDAFAAEHSLELQLPFLWRRNPNVSLIPVCLGPLSPDACLALGASLARTVRDLPGDTLIVASSDMNHFDTSTVGEAKDRRAIDRLEALDPRGLYNTVRAHNISMCGVVAASAALQAAIQLGATASELIQYEDSSIASGDNRSVVGYAGIRIRAQ
jgi:AmmeMemoRadiSam system protein B